MSDAASKVERETLGPNEVRLSCGGASFTYKRLKPGMLLMTIAGNDMGQFGVTTIDEVDDEFERFGPVTLFIDTQAATGPATEVMKAWTAYFAANRRKLTGVHIYVLPESKLLHLTVSIVHHLSGLGGLLQLYGESEPFQKAMQAAIAKR